MNIYLITAMVAVTAWIIGVQLFSKEYPVKSKFTMCTLPVLAVLTCFQAALANIPRVSIAWWLVVAIIFVLFISTYIGYKEWKKANEITENDEEDVEGNLDV